MRLPRLALGSAALLVASAVLAQAPPAASAPAPAAPPASGDFYPIKPGAKWVYRVGETTITVKVAGPDGDGTKLETEVNGKTVASEVVKVTPDGVSRIKINTAAITPPVQILKLQGGKAVKGEKWKVESTIQGSAVKGEFSIKDDAEKVKIQGVDYSAVCVEGPEFDIAGTKTAVKYWFVGGKGVVKLMYSIQGNEAVLELKEYTEGK